jgi:hypothetical protein
MFIAGFDPVGTNLWAKTWGDTGGANAGYGIAVDSAGHLALTGTCQASVNFDGLGVSWLYGYVVASFTVSGNSAPVYRWAKGSAYSDFGDAIAFGPHGDVITSGYLGRAQDLGGISVGSGPFVAAYSNR